MNTRADLISLTRYFLKFLRSPIDTIKAMPNSHFISLLIFQEILSAVFGAMAGLLSSQSWHIWIWIIALPLVTLIIGGLIGSVLLVTFKLYLRRDESFEKIYRLVFVSIIPFIVFFPILSFLPPLFLVCCLLSALLLIVGLVENFHVPQKVAIRIIGLMSLVFVVLWIFNQIQSQEGLSNL